MITCPFSVRPKPASLGDYTFNNSFVGMMINLRIVSSILEGVKLINDDMQALKKNFLEPFAIRFSYAFGSQLPPSAIHKGIEDGTAKYTFGFSNVPGPR